MKRIPTILLFSLPLATSCLGRRGCGAAGDADSLAMTGIVYPFTIDVSGDYPMEPVSFQEVLGELEYVALETSPECLIADLTGLQSPVVTDNDIFILSGPNPILRFSREGKFIGRIGNPGRGPGEFLAAGGIWANDAAEEIFLYDIYGKGFLVYGYDGRYKRTLRTNANSMIGDMVALTDSTLLIANKYDFERAPVDAYQLISSKNGRVLKTVLPHFEEPDLFVPTDMKPPAYGMIGYLGLPEAESDPAEGFKSGAGGVGLIMRYDTPYGVLSEANTIYTTHAGVELSTFLADTVYTVSASGELIPRWIKTPSPAGRDVPRRRYSKLGLEGERYAYFPAVGAGEKSGYKLDKRTGTITRAYLYDANIDHLQTRENRILFPTGLSRGRLAMPYQPLWLIGLSEEGKLSGPLAQIAATLKENDNPVLLIQKNR